MRQVRRFFGAGVATVVAVGLVIAGAPPAVAATPVVTVSVQANPLSRPEPGGDFTTRSG
jgi:hypothetical protein